MSVTIVDITFKLISQACLARITNNLVEVMKYTIGKQIFQNYLKIYTILNSLLYI